MDKYRARRFGEIAPTPMVSPYLERPLRSQEEVSRQRDVRQARLQDLREQIMAVAGGDD